jgi:hypothetical protein
VTLVCFAVSCLVMGWDADASAAHLDYAVNGAHGSEGSHARCSRVSRSPRKRNTRRVGKVRVSHRHPSHRVDAKRGSKRSRCATSTPLRGSTPTIELPRGGHEAPLSDLPPMQAAPIAEPRSGLVESDEPGLGVSEPIQEGVEAGPPSGGVESESKATDEDDSPFRFFSSTSVWNEPVSAGAQIDPSSSRLVATFDEEIAHEEQLDVGPWINTTKYSVPIYTVSAAQPTVHVELVEHTPEAALISAWGAVPLPADAQPAAGTDGDLFVWQPSSEKLWEFWRLARRSGKWQATWGGAMEHVSSASGVYESNAWPGAQPWWGVSASSLSLVGGVVTIEDLKLGQINHALEMAIPGARARVYASPAQRTDGTSESPTSLPEGAHLILNPNLDLASLHLPHLTLMIAEAAQRYGIFITDSSRNVEINAEDPTPTGTNPYTGLDGYFEGKQPGQLLASFPWSQLELLKMELHSMP